MRFFWLVCFILMGPVFADEPNAYQWVVDDLGLNRKFQNQMTAAIKKGNAVSSHEAILKQLKSEPTTSLPAPSTTARDKQEPSAEQRYNQLRKSTLLVGPVYKCDKCDQWHPSLAGGVMITKDLAVTNYHVINTEHAKVGGYGAMTQDGRVFPITEIVAASENHDIAIVRLSGKRLPPPAKIGKLPIPGTEVYTMSRPAGHSFSITKGIVSRYFRSSRKEIEDKKFSPRVVMQITADFARGSSGSGIFNSQGQLVGLVAFTRTITKKANVQMVIKGCVPITEVQKLFVEETLNEL